jgi:orotidine-5'-phosphate decarboxylase
MSYESDKLIVSLDFEDIVNALSLVDLIKDEAKFYKIGLQMYLKYGEKIISEIKKRDLKIFLDLKLNDIPNTVKEAVKVLISYSLEIINMHTLSGYDAMKEAKSIIVEKAPSTKIIGVTILTSLDDDNLKKLGFELSSDKQTEKLSLLAKDAGLDGVVASAKDVRKIKEICGNPFLIICPGIRRETEKVDDQKRIATPYSAIKDGADYIVVGRPIIKSNSPKIEVLDIIKEINKGLLER